jgi:hypothetical protein
MNCSAVKRWLDEGMASGLEPSALTHAARCPECSALIQSQREIDAAFSLDLEPETQADRSLFVDRVMRRVASAESARQRVDLWPAMRSLPWWVEAAADPAVVLASVLAALVLWKKIDWFAAFARLLSERWSVLALPAIAQARDALGFDRPAVALGLGLLIVLLVGWVSFHLYRWSERLTRRSAGA